MDVLKEKAEAYLAKNNHQLHVCLIYDEMHIRKELCYCSENQSFIGFSTVTNSSGHINNPNSDLKLAKEALVYLVAGPDFKLAVAYELLDGLESEDRAALTLKVITCIEKVGAKVVSLTGDGLAANTTTAESLGAKFDEMKPYFWSPTYTKQKIYVIHDPCHMLKLVRKHFSSNKIHFEDRLVDWNLLVQIVERQSTDNFNLRNKLTNLHINWGQKPMNVRLAAETLSKSVADMLLQLRNDKYGGFENAAITSEFIQFFNDGFDILNFGENRKGDKKFKRKLCKDTANTIFEFGEKFKRYISKLEYRNLTKSDPILLSNAEKGFFGFYMNFISLRGIYEDFVLNGPLSEFYTFQFSQDHLETYFSLVR